MCLLTCSDSVGPHFVRAGQLVFVDDQRLIGTSDTPVTAPNRVPVINLQFSIKDIDPMFQVQAGATEGSVEATLLANTALFGADPSLPGSDREQTRFVHRDGVRLVQDPSNQYGCDPYERSFLHEVLLVDRGECTFLKKLLTAKDAGASGVIVINSDDTRVTPSIDDDERAEVGNLADDVVLVVLTKTAGKTVTDMISRAQGFGVGQVMFTVDPESMQVAPRRKRTKVDTSSNVMDKLKDDIHKVLYLNGHALVNTRLVVL